MAKKENRHAELVSASANIEAPYELPDGWKWCRLMDCASVISKGTTPKGGKDAYLKEGVNFLRIENLNDDGSINLSNISHISVEEHEGNLKRSILKEGDLLISIAGTLGKVGFVTKADLPMNTNQAIAFVRLHKDIFDNKYLKYAIESPFVNAELLTKTKVTSIPNLTLEIISNCLIPLPPTLAEQQRIVNRIETMFAKLDQAQEKAQAVLDSFETRKAAILHKAFTGQLTANWRKANGVPDDSWEEKKISDCCIPRAGYAFDSKKFTTVGFQIIRMGNLYAGELDLSRNPVYYSENDLDDSIKKRALIADGDILITLTGTKYKRDYGYAVRIDNPNDLLVNQRILCLTPKNEIKTNYLLYYLHSNMFRDVFFSNETGGVNQGNVSSKFVESISFRMPSLPEQQEIVRILDAVLEKETRAKEAAQTVLDQIALLKKSILARAFRGEL